MPGWKPRRRGRILTFPLDHIMGGMTEHHQGHEPEILARRERLAIDHAPPQRQAAGKLLAGIQENPKLKRNDNEQRAEEESPHRWKTRLHEAWCGKDEKEHHAGARKEM